MLGSKKSELTRKYSSSSFEAITFGLSSSCRVAYSRKPTAANASASTTSTPRPARNSRAGPVDVAQDREQQRERDVEEDGLLERLVERGRVGGLEGVEHHRAREQPLHRAVRARRVEAVAAADPRHGPRERARGDDEVERDEQVRGRSAGLDRDAERQRGERGERQRGAAAGEQQRERHDDERRSGDPAGQRGQRVLAHDVELRRLPDRQHEQHGRERERPEHRPGARPRRRREDRRRGERRRDDDPERADDLGTGCGVDLGDHSNVRISGVAPRRMSAMLRVSC